MESGEKDVEKQANESGDDGRSVADIADISYVNDESALCDRGVSDPRQYIGNVVGRRQEDGKVSLWKGK